MDILNKISKTAALAERLNVGVIITGPVTLTEITRLAEIEAIEDFFIGHAIISKAIMFGLNDAIAEFKTEVNKI